MPPARLVLLIAVLALLVLPIFAHGCHGDDEDHEPGLAPPVSETRVPAGR
jgi:hypothetical protein